MIKIFAVFRMMGFTLPKNIPTISIWGYVRSFSRKSARLQGQHQDLTTTWKWFWHRGVPIGECICPPVIKRGNRNSPLTDLSIYLSIYLSIHQSNLSIYLSIHPSNLSIYLSIYLSFYLSSIHPSILPSFLPSFHLPVYLSLNNSCCTFTTCCT